MFNKGEIDSIVQVARRSGDIIMEYYRGAKDSGASLKRDNSVVTKADLAANTFIIEELSKLFPNIPIVSEENSQEDNLNSLEGGMYFIIDPLDGTSAFIKGSEEFSVNIALIKERSSIFGVIYLPAKDLLYFTNEGGASYKVENYSNQAGEVVQINTAKNKDNLVVICTKREPEKSEIIADLNSRKISIKEIISVSSSYKFCLIAEGSADLYPRKVNIKAWDVAAGHAIVNGGGGNMVDAKTGKEIEYDLERKFDIEMFEVF